MEDLLKKLHEYNRRFVLNFKLIALTYSMIFYLNWVSLQIDEPDLKIQVLDFEYNLFFFPILWAFKNYLKKYLIPQKI